MRIPETPVNEPERLRALRETRLLDTLPDPVFDRITRVAKLVFTSPMALITLVDAERQWFLSKQGFDVSETSRDVSFCGHAILFDELFVIPNASEDERFAKNPLVSGPLGVKFYAGAPLRTPEGYALGTLCVLDLEPRTITSEQRLALKDLAALVVDELERRRVAFRPLLASAVEPPSATKAPPPAFLPDEFLDRIGGDQELFVELLDTFSSDAERQLVALKEAIQRGDLRKAAAQAHQLKGSSATVSATELALIAAECEVLGTSGSLARLALASEKLPVALARFAETIRPIVASATADRSQ